MGVACASDQGVTDYICELQVYKACQPPVLREVSKDFCVALELFILGAVFPEGFYIGTHGCEVGGDFSDVVYGGLGKGGGLKGLVLTTDGFDGISDVVITLLHTKECLSFF
jgi:hypothetical protein